MEPRWPGSLALAFWLAAWFGGAPLSEVKKARVCASSAGSARTLSMIAPTAASISCTALPVPPWPVGIAGPVPMIEDVPHHCALQNCGLWTWLNGM